MVTMSVPFSAQAADGEQLRLLHVHAHPDDESFGLGAVIDGFIQAGAEVEVLCFTQGEASTLGAAPDLALTRAEELTRQRPLLR